MGWVRYIEPEGIHQCSPPLEGKIMRRPPANPGSLWRCDICLRLWRVSNWVDYGSPTLKEPSWEPANLWQRIRFRSQGRPAPRDTQGPPEKVRIVDAV